MHTYSKTASTLEVKQSKGVLNFDWELGDVSWQLSLNNDHTLDELESSPGVFVFAGCNLPELYARRAQSGGVSTLILPPDILARVQGQSPLYEAMRELEAEGVLARRGEAYSLARAEVDVENRAEG
jgi:hypothetical protein